jgi:hypothetical protein
MFRATYIRCCQQIDTDVATRRLGNWQERQIAGANLAGNQALAGFLRECEA